MRTPLLRYLGIHLALGVATGWTLLAALIATDTASLHDLVWSSRNGFVAIWMLAIVFGVTFGSAAIGVGVMLLKDGPQRDTSAPAGGLRSREATDRPHAAERDRPA